MMKFLKRILLTLLILIATGLFFRGWLYRHLVTYKSVGQRTNYLATDNKLLEYIDRNANGQTDPDIKEIIKLGLSITSKQLNFTTSENNSDPNKLIESKTAHCVGYASFFAATCNYLFKKNIILKVVGLQNHRLGNFIWRGETFINISTHLFSQTMIL